MRFRRALVVGLSIAALVAGCERAPYSLAPVSGVVTLDGKPVPGAQISFQPQGGSENKNPGPGSAGICDEAGRYELATIRNEPGAVLGPHAVRIYGPKINVNSSSDTDAPATAELIPARYNFQTELSFDVPPDGTDSASFELTSK